MTSTQIADSDILDKSDQAVCSSSSNHSNELQISRSHSNSSRKSAAKISHPRSSNENEDPELEELLALRKMKSMD